jgi:hypothetical protein
MITNYENSLLGTITQGLDGTAIRLQAVKSFNLALNRGRLGQFLAKITGKPSQLETLTSQPVTSHRPTNRIISVPIREITGSLGRNEDFDKNFNPLKEYNRSRWINVATAYQMGISLPPVELVQVGSKYFVRDGHHRISVAKSMEQEMIDARILN